MLMKGDWFELIKQDFKFIGEELNEQDIASTPKKICKVKIKKLVETAAFEYMIKVKNGLSKTVDIKYDTLRTQST